MLMLVSALLSVYAKVVTLKMMLDPLRASDNLFLPKYQPCLSNFSTVESLLAVLHAKAVWMIDSTIIEEIDRALVN